MFNEPVYVDTNIIMDFLLERDHAAYLFLDRALRCEFLIIISDVVLHELTYQGLELESSNLIQILRAGGKCIILHVSEEDKKEAKAVVAARKTHYNDALHASVACRSGCKAFVTKNLKDFTCFKDLNVKRADEI